MNSSSKSKCKVIRTVEASILCWGKMEEYSWKYQIYLKKILFSLPEGNIHLCTWENNKKNHHQTQKTSNDARRLLVMRLPKKRKNRWSESWRSTLLSRHQSPGYLKLVFHSVWCVWNSGYSFTAIYKSALAPLPSIAWAQKACLTPQKNISLVNKENHSSPGMVFCQYTGLKELTKSSGQQNYNIWESLKLLL